VRRGDGVHDRAARSLVAHAEGGFLAAHEGAVHVHAQDGSELVVAHLEEGAVAHVAGVVHDAVNAAELVDAALHQGLRALAVADVAGVDDGLAALGRDFVDHLLRFVAVDVVHHHRGAVGCRVQAVAAADAAPGAGDDDPLAVEDSHTSPGLPVFSRRIV
jgi:hypothetical protein